MTNERFPHLTKLREILEKDASGLDADIQPFFVSSVGAVRLTGYEVEVRDRKIPEERIQAPEPATGDWKKWFPDEHDATEAVYSLGRSIEGSRFPSHFYVPAGPTQGDDFFPILDAADFAGGNFTFRFACGCLFAAHGALWAYENEGRRALDRNDLESAGDAYKRIVLRNGQRNSCIRTLDGAIFSLLPETSERPLRVRTRFGLSFGQAVDRYAIAVTRYRYLRAESRASGCLFEPQLRMNEYIRERATLENMVDAILGGCFHGGRERDNSQNHRVYS